MKNKQNWLNGFTSQSKALPDRNSYLDTGLQKLIMGKK